jgi:type I restriction enzyme S subunit
MNTSWPREPLGSAIQQRKEFIQINDLDDYKRCRVQLHAEGIVLRDTVSGAEIKTKKQQVCKAGDFLVAEIDAKVGGFGIVPDNLDGAIVSSHYFLFEVNEQKLNRRFLDFFIRTPGFKDQVTAQGSTNYAAIRPADVLEYNVPFPPVSEQRRIVARVEELAAKINEARTLKQQAVAEADTLLGAFLSCLCRSSTWKTMTVGELVGQDSLRNGRSVKPTGDIGEVRCLTLSAIRNGRIDIHDNKVVPLTLTEAEPFLIRKGDVFVVRGNGSKNLCGMAGLVTEDADSVIFPDLFIHVPLPKQYLLPEFFVAAWNSAATRDIIEEKAKTTSGIWKINQGHISSTEVPVPPLPEQRHIVAELKGLQAQVDALKKLQAETAAELDALLPSILDKAFKGEL